MYAQIVKWTRGKASEHSDHSGPLYPIHPSKEYPGILQGFRYWIVTTAVINKAIHIRNSQSDASIFPVLGWFLSLIGLGNILKINENQRFWRKNRKRGCNRK